MQTVTYVCDSGFRNRLEYPYAGRFAIEPMVTNRVSGTSDNYSLAAPYDNGELVIPGAATPPLQAIMLRYLASMPIDHFYMGHLLTLFGPFGRAQYQILDSRQASSTLTELVIDPAIDASVMGPGGGNDVTLYYWISQSAAISTVVDVQLLDPMRISAPKSTCMCRTGLDYAVLLYVPDAMTGFPQPSTQPFVSFVNAFTSSDPSIGCKRARDPADPSRCVIELATAAPSEVLLSPNSFVMDVLIVNGVTNGNNVGNTRWVASVQSMIFNTRWPRPSGTPPNMFRVRLEQVLLPSCAPVRQFRRAYDSQLTRDVDTQRNGGYITDFPYVVVELALNRQAEYQTIMVPSQAPVMGSFLAVMDTYRSPIKTFIVARCSTTVMVPTNVWEHILVTVRLPNGDVVDFLPHPSMARRILYAGSDPLRQIQAVFVVDGVAKS